MCSFYLILFCIFFFSSRRRHTRCALVTGVQTCALPIFAAARLVVGKRNASSPRCRFAQEEGRSGGRINLVPVMHFDDLDVPILAEASRRVLHQSGEQVNAQGCVTRLQNGNGLGGLIDERMMESLKAGRTDDEGLWRHKNGVQMGLQERKKTRLNSSH